MRGDKREWKSSLLPLLSRSALLFNVLFPAPFLCAPAFNRTLPQSQPAPPPRPPTPEPPRTPTPPPPPEEEEEVRKGRGQTRQWRGEEEEGRRRGSKRRGSRGMVRRRGTKTENSTPSLLLLLGKCGPFGSREGV
jgi:hypothetical protein